MQSRNRLCNALQVVIGLFCHSTNTPEKTIETLNHMGISISLSSINNMVDSLSAKSPEAIKQLWKDLLGSEAFDNLDVSFKTEQTTIEKGNRLVNMATGTYFPLLHGVVPNDLKCTKAMWAGSEFNPERKEEPRITVSHVDMMALAGKKIVRQGDPKSTENLMAFHIRKIIMEHIPALAELFKDNKDVPEPVLQVPPTKTPQFPARAMNINVGTNSGAAAALNNLSGQAGVSKDTMEEFVTLVHGDLGIGEKILAMQESRSIENSAANRFAHVQFLPGVFHIKIACVLALHKIYIESSKPQAGCLSEKGTIFDLCTILRPKEIKKLSNNPGFRMLHTVIHHILIASIVQSCNEVLKTWAAAAESDQSRTGTHAQAIDLIRWAKREPTWHDMMRLSDEVVKTFVAPFTFHPKPAEQGGDMVYDTMKLWNRDALLYAMTSHAANTGDVGRLEVLLIHWVHIWKATGKHKYAKHVSRFLVSLDHGWPPRLARAIRMNWLVNPTGKSDGFRGADWVLERNNLRHKRTHSGQGPNRTIKYIIKQSPLVDLFQNVHKIVEQSFYLTNRTLKHPPPRMKKTLGMLEDYMKQCDLHQYQRGRALPDKMTPRNAIMDGVAIDLGGNASTKAEDAEAPTCGDIGVDEA